eukprot:scaffold10524_cov113-Isochrysis_galbana.AAC.4
MRCHVKVPGVSRCAHPPVTCHVSRFITLHKRLSHSPTHFTHSSRVRDIPAPPRGAAPRTAET